MVRTPQHALLDVLQRVRHQLAIEHAIDGAPQPDQFGPAGDHGRGRQRAKLEAGPVVVQDDAPIQIAHDHALRELRHERRQTALLQLDVLAGLFHTLVHIAAQLPPLLNQQVDHARQRPVLGAAPLRQLTCYIRTRHRTTFFGQLGGRRQEMLHQRMERKTADPDEGQAHHHNQGHRRKAPLAPDL